jgi:hypothetical protein
MAWFGKLTAVIKSGPGFKCINCKMCLREACTNFTCVKNVSSKNPDEKFVKLSVTK